MLILKLMLSAVGILFLYYLTVSMVTGFKNNRIDRDDPVAAAFLGISSGFMTAIGWDGLEPTMTVLEEDLEDGVKVRNTVMVGLTAPVIAGSIIFLNTYKIELSTVILIGFSGVAGIIASMFLRLDISNVKIREYNAMILLIMGGIMLFQKFHYLNNITLTPLLTGLPLIYGMAGNFVLGMVLSQGISVFTPGFGLFVFLGITPRSAFTLLLICLSLIMPISSGSLIREGKYYRKTAFFMAVTGIVGIYFGFRFFNSQPIEYVRWLLIISMVLGGIINLLGSVDQKRI